MKRRWQYLQTNSTVHLARIFCRRPNSLPCPSVSIGIIANILINSHRSFSWSSLYLSFPSTRLSRSLANARSHSHHRLLSSSVPFLSTSSSLSLSSLSLFLSFSLSFFASFADFRMLSLLLFLSVFLDCRSSTSLFSSRAKLVSDTADSWEWDHYLYHVARESSYRCLQRAQNRWFSSDLTRTLEGITRSRESEVFARNACIWNTRSAVAYEQRVSNVKATSEVFCIPYEDA